MPSAASVIFLKSPKISYSVLFGAVLLSLSLSVAAQQQINKDYLNPSLPVDRRVDGLLKQMTLEEKIGQMNMSSLRAPDVDQIVCLGGVGSFVGATALPQELNRIQKEAVEKSRLGIPLLFGMDVVHGYSTIFPIPLAQASMWNPELARTCASIAAREASSQGTRWTMSPMVDIARDPRWGRIAEGAGEDPCLGMAMARALVEGYQGPQLSPDSGLVACVKHFAGYGAAEGGRDYNTTDIPERTLRDVYLPPFKAAVDAGVGTVMSAFNDLDGIPATANPFLIRGILKREWGFPGFIRADANAVDELVNHGVAWDDRDATLKAVTAGLDMASHPYPNYLPALVRDEQVPMSMIDDSVRRILEVKFRIGLFENPYVDLDKTGSSLRLPGYLKTAREAACQSIVLLKNASGLLPLDKDIKSIAVIGPLANDRADLLGCWHTMGQAASVVSLLQGVKSKASSSTRVIYAQGCGITRSSPALLSAAVEASRQADVIILAVGESSDMTGEGASRSSLDLPEPQEQLVQAICKLGKPVVEVLMNGRPLSIDWDTGHVPAILETWFLGTEAGNGIADVLFGDYNPSGKLPVTFPRTVGQIPMYYDHMDTGRPPSLEPTTSKYRDIPWTPLYPFGYGLSYTTFVFSNFKVERDRHAADQFTVAVDVTNTGKRSGTETVELYIRQRCASVTRPVEQLEGFQQVELSPGQSRTVHCQLTPLNLSFYNAMMQRVVEAGPLEVMVGDSSADVITNTTTITQSMPVGPPGTSPAGRF
jgi:beta-glucosidase